MLPGPRTRTTLTAALAPLLMTLASCGQDADGPPSAAVSTAPNGDVVSSTDVAFAQAEDGESPPARELAEEVVDTQEREVDEMRRLLADLGA